MGRRQIDEVALEVDTAEQHADRWHDDVVDQGRDDRTEGDAHDDTDSQVDDIAAGNEGLEFLKHPLPPKSLLVADDGRDIKIYIQLPSGYSKTAKPPETASKTRI